MYLYYLQNTASLEDKEKELSRFKVELRHLSEASPPCSLPSPYPWIILETCDRYEIYTPEPIAQALYAKLFASKSSAEPNRPNGKTLWSQKQGPEALRHLFRVVSGLESPIFGEKAIQGQVKQAYLKASQASLASHKLPKELHINFQKALYVGKRVRHETQLDFGAMSHARATWEILQAELRKAELKKAELKKSTLQNLSVCLIGVTNLNEELVKLFSQQGIHKFFLGNRSHTKAQEISKRYGGKAFALKHTQEILEQCQVLISATRAPHYIIRKQHILQRSKPLYAFDLAMPRDIEPQIKSERIQLWNIEDIEKKISINKEERKKRSEQAEQIIAEELEQHLKSCEAAFQFPSHAADPKNPKTATQILISRASNLAKAQVQEFLHRFKTVQTAQETQAPDFTLRTIESQGDKDKQRSLLEGEAPPNFFTHELDESLLCGEADWALHSAKDLPLPLPTGLPTGLKLWALLAAENKSQPETDCLVSTESWTLQNLPQGARIGTSSASRKQQLLELRPDLEIVSIRGTIEERIARVAHTSNARPSREQNGGQSDKPLHAVVVANCAIQRLLKAQKQQVQAQSPHMDLKELLQKAQTLPIQVHPLQGYLAVVGRSELNKAQTVTAQHLKQLDARLNWGSVTLVGAGAGAAGLLTLDGQRALQEADIIFYDALVGKELLDFAFRAEKNYVGKRSASHSMSQDEICRQLWQAARQGKQVVRLKGGDSLLFARAAEELQALSEALVDFRVLPGISAAFAAAASLALPLTQRGDSGSSLHLLSAYPPERIDFASLPLNGNIIFYMGMAQRQTIKERALAAGRNPDDPVLVVIWATLPEQENLYTTLEELPHLNLNKKEKSGQKSAGLIMLGPIADKAGQMRTIPTIAKAPTIRKLDTQPSDWLNSLDLTGKTWITGLKRDMDPETPNAKIWHLPLLELTERSGMEANLLAALAECNLLLFTSKYAVRYFFANLERSEQDIRILANKSVVSIGKATGKELKTFGLCLHEPQDWQSPEESSKGLIAEFARRKLGVESAALRAQKILIPSSSKALPLLTSELPKPENGGHSVKRIILYENILPENLQRLFLEIDLYTSKLKDLKAIYLSSPSTAEYFAELVAKPLFQHFGKGFPEHWEYRCKGEPTRERLAELQAKYGMLDWLKPSASKTSASTTNSQRHRTDSDPLSSGVLEK